MNEIECKPKIIKQGVFIRSAESEKSQNYQASLVFSLRLLGIRVYETFVIHMLPGP